MSGNNTAWLPALLLLAGCATPRPQALWLEGKSRERAGSPETAIRYYEAAYREGLPVARFDLAALRFRSDDPKLRESALLLWLDASLLGATSIYSTQADSEAIAVGALASLAQAFESGDAVPADKRLAGFLYDRASELRNGPTVDRWFLKNGNSPEYARVVKAASAIEPGRRRLRGLYSTAVSWDYFQIRGMIETDSDESGGNGSSYKLVEQSHDPSLSSWIFVVEFDGGGLDVQRRFVAEAARIMKEAYVTAHPETRADALFVCDQDRIVGNGEFTYKAALVAIGRPEMSLEPSFSVSAQTGRGVLRIPCDPSRIANAFSFAQSNIETIVNSQNVLLTTGRKPPSGARYRVDDVKTVAGASGETLLEVHFTVE